MNEAAAGRRGESRRREGNRSVNGTRGRGEQRRRTGFGRMARWVGWGLAGRPSAQCCPTFEVELNVSRYTTTWRWIGHTAFSCAYTARRLDHVRYSSFFLTFFATVVRTTVILYGYRLH